jgi:hypothetical protein
MRDEMVPRASTRTAKKEEQTLYVGAIGDRAFFRLFSDEGVASEGIENLERQLSEEFEWFERLGRIPVTLDPDVGLTFTGDDVQRLALLCSRRLVEIEDPVALDYRVTDWGPLH